MASIYDITFNDRAKDALAPRKRKPRILSLLYAFLYPLQWVRDLFFNVYAKGAYAGAYDIGSTYTEGQVVMYYDYQLYIAIRNVPIMTPCIQQNYWQPASLENVGLIQRANVNGQKLSLEYVLNKHFNTTFRQPAAGTSDIFVENLHVDTAAFLVGVGPGDTATAALNGQTARDFVGIEYDYNPYGLVIWVPTATLYLISGSTEVSPFPEAQKIVLFYANRFIFAGIKATVSEY